jgi:hypothetical protein
MRKKEISRRRFLQCATLGTAGFVAVLADGYLIGRERIVVERQEVVLTRLAREWDGLRIVQLSDFHYVTLDDGELIREAVRIANGLSPDLVVLTGDYITVRSKSDRSQARNATPCAEILSDLRAPLGTFAVLGNHDQCNPSFIIRALETHGITVLKNFAIYVEKFGRRLWVAGVDDVMFGRPQIMQTLEPIPHGGFTILLAHEPDYADVVKHYPVDLQLSGHSHGGQVRLPFLGAPYLPPLARKYPWGLRRLGSLNLYTNRGLGTIILPMRLNDPPEVTLLTLRSGAQG